eukprot:gb/GECH01004482.1/.p1 GENE.gb/GECH01004482.1/~~gb/GECH01004482.1/.p1  ORF type:complete len:923 (+),score=201.31 gb/GECH01004482.1/:1-2769(+)
MNELDVYQLSKDLEDLGGGNTKLAQAESYCYCNPYIPNFEPCSPRTQRVVVNDNQITCTEDNGWQGKIDRSYKLNEVFDGRLDSWRYSMESSLANSLVNWIWTGFNGTVLNIGQRLSGKTSVLLGNLDYTLTDPESQLGLIILVARKLFKRIRDFGNDNYSIGVSCFSITNFTQKDDISGIDELLFDPTTHYPSSPYSNDKKNVSSVKTCSVSSLEEFIRFIVLSCCNTGDWKAWGDDSLKLLPDPTSNHTCVRISLHNKRKKRVSFLYFLDTVGFEKLEELAEVQYFFNNLSSPEKQSLENDDRWNEFITQRKLYSILWQLVSTNSKLFTLGCISLANEHVEFSRTVLDIIYRLQDLKTPCMRIPIESKSTLFEEWRLSERFIRNVLMGSDIQCDNESDPNSEGEKDDFERSREELKNVADSIIENILGAEEKGSKLRPIIVNNAGNSNEMEDNENFHLTLPPTVQRSFEKQEKEIENQEYCKYDRSQISEKSESSTSCHPSSPSSEKPNSSPLKSQNQISETRVENNEDNQSEPKDQNSCGEESQSSRRDSLGSNHKNQEKFSPRLILGSKSKSLDSISDISIDSDHISSLRYEDQVYLLKRKLKDAEHNTNEKTTSLHLQIEDLKYENLRLRSKLRRFEYDSHFSEVLNVYSNENGQLLDENEDLKRQIAELYSSMEQLKHSGNNLNSGGVTPSDGKFYNSNQEQLRLAKRKVSTLSKTIKDQANEISKLNQEKSSLEKSEKMKETSRKLLSTATNKLGTMEKELKDYKQALNGRDKIIEDLKEENTKLNERLMEKQTEYNESVNKQDIQNEEIGEMRKLLDILQSEKEILVQNRMRKSVENTATRKSIQKSMRVIERDLCKSPKSLLQVQKLKGEIEQLEQELIAASSREKDLITLMTHRKQPSKDTFNVDEMLQVDN